jgi:Zn-dependent M16 (insulinase) family peptidase
MMNALEAPLWRYIRGAGLAYGASISINAEVGLCNFSLYRSPDSSKAYKEAKKVMEALANNGVTSTGEVLPGLQLDQTSLDSAKSLLHFNVADAEGTVSQAAWEVIVDETLKGVGRGRGRLLLQKVKDVTLEDCQRVLKEWILPIFNSETSVVAVACGPGKVEEIKRELEGCGYGMERRDLDFGNEEGEGESEGSESGSSEESSSTGSSSSGDEDTDMKD